MQVFCFVVCSFRLSHGVNGVRCKRNKKYWLKILVCEAYTVSGKDGERLEKKQAELPEKLMQKKKQEIKEGKTLQINFSPLS